MVPTGCFVEGSALKLPFSDSTFDAAVFFEVIEHLPRRSEPAALAEIRRVLRPGAALLLSTPYAHPMSCCLDPAWYLGHRHYSTTRLTKLLTSARFSVDRILVRGGTFELLGVLAFYIFKWIFRAEVPFREWIDAGREREFLTERQGYSTVFAVATAV